MASTATWRRTARLPATSGLVPNLYLATNPRYVSSFPRTRTPSRLSVHSPKDSERRSMNGFRMVVTSDTATVIWYMGLVQSPVPAA